MYLKLTFESQFSVSAISSNLKLSCTWNILKVIEKIKKKFEMFIRELMFPLKHLVLYRIQPTKIYISH